MAPKNRFITTIYVVFVVAAEALPGRAFPILGPGAVAGW